MGDGDVVLAEGGPTCPGLGADDGAMVGKDDGVERRVLEGALGGIMGELLKKKIMSELLKILRG